MSTKESSQEYLKEFQLGGIPGESPSRTSDGVLNETQRAILSRNLEKFSVEILCEFLT